MVHEFSLYKLAKYQRYGQTCSVKTLDIATEAILIQVYNYVQLII